MAKNRNYDQQFKIQAVKLYHEIGASKAAKELGISNNTLWGWIVASRSGKLDLGDGSHTPNEALSLNEQIKNLNQYIKKLEKENKRLKEENEFLEEASAFFAASRLKSAKTKE